MLRELLPCPAAYGRCIALITTELRLQLARGPVPRYGGDILVQAVIQTVQRHTAVTISELWLRQVWSRMIDGYSEY